MTQVAASKAMWIFDTKLLLFALVLLWLGIIRQRRKVQSRMSQIQWTGVGIDVGPLVERLERVRQDYIAPLQSRPRQAWHRRALMAMARHALERLAYFRKSNEEKSPN